MFCSKCGRQLDEEHAFCPSCGTARSSEAVQLSDTVDQQPASVAVKTSSKKKIILISSICVVAAIVLICLATAVLGGNSGNKVVGKWQAKDTPSVYMTLNKDNTGEMSSGGISIKLNWTYSKSTNVITLSVVGVDTFTVKYNPKSDTISQNNVTFIRVS